MKNFDFTKWSTWIHGLAAACISAGATTLAAVLSSFIGQVSINWHQLWVSVGVSSMVAGALYLKSSPLPSDATVQTITFEPNKVTTTTETKPSLPPQT